LFAEWDKTQIRDTKSLSIWNSIFTSIKLLLLPLNLSVHIQLTDTFSNVFTIAKIPSIAPFIISHDLVEVNDRWCWSIKRRSFFENAIQDHQIGKVSPRAFCPYDPARDPDPKDFKEVLENGLVIVVVVCFFFLNSVNHL